MNADSPTPAGDLAELNRLLADEPELRWLLSNFLGPHTVKGLGGMPPGVRQALHDAASALAWKASPPLTDEERWSFAKALAGELRLGLDGDTPAQRLQALIARETDGHPGLGQTLSAYFGGLLDTTEEAVPQVTTTAEATQGTEAGPCRDVCDAPKALPKKRSYRLPDFERRKAIWDAIALRWNQKLSYKECRNLLLDKHANLLKRGKKGPTISNKTLKSIISDGLAGLLK